MGYTIKIGNAVPFHDKEDGYLRASWRVQGSKSDDAPTFPNDGMTANTNERSPSYTGWADFARDVGLEELFFSKDGGLMRQHPGCQLLTREHHALISAALERTRATATLPPGFWGIRFDAGRMTYPDEGKYDPQLARLTWLEWWVRWALDSCETPAIENT